MGTRWAASQGSASRWYLVSALVAGVALAAPAVARAQTWAPAGTLMRAGVLEEQSFGTTLSLRKNALMVGAPYEGGAMIRGGAVYVFSGSNWADVARIEVSNIVDFEGFGRSLDMDGDVALVGNGWIDNAKVWAFEKVGGTWTEKQRIQEADTEAFGFRLSVHGDVALIASPKDGADVGRVHVYARDQGLWAEVQELSASDAMDSDFFGYAMDWDGTRVIVGASANLLFPTRTGAYTFSRVGGRFVEDGQLVGADPVERSFGYSVSVSGDTLAVAAPPGRDRMNNGKAFVYVRSGNDWVQQQEFTAPEEEQFPMSVTVQGDALWMGAMTGKTWTARAYRRTAGTWTEVQKVSVELAQWNLPAVRISGGTVACGVPDDGAQGSVRLFRTSGDDPPPDQPTGGAGGGTGGGAGISGSGGSGTAGHGGAQNAGASGGTAGSGGATDTGASGGMGGHGASGGGNGTPNASDSGNTGGGCGCVYADSTALGSGFALFATGLLLAACLHKRTATSRTRRARRAG